MFDILLAIFDEILKDIPIYNNTLYIVHEKKNHTVLLKQDEKQV